MKNVQVLDMVWTTGRNKVEGIEIVIVVVMSGVGEVDLHGMDSVKGSLIIDLFCVFFIFSIFSICDPCALCASYLFSIFRYILFSLMVKTYICMC